ncbi:MAG: murein L,D-transpeptidase family protein [Succinivibrio sp.]
MFRHFILLCLLTLIQAATADTYRNLPADILAKAVCAEIVYDEDFDYTILKTSSNIISNAMVTEQAPAVQKGIVDHVVVYKSAHQMILFKDNQEIKKFWIALSDRPVGKKQFEGDKKTPEGSYTLDYVKHRSNYYKAMHISYPNMQDIEYARSQGRRPGGMIMVHGQPPIKGDYHESVQRSDWTDGCIALLNPDLDIFLSLVDIGTTITIKP